MPGKVAPGTVSNETICHTDLLATVAAVVGAELSADEGPDSYSILPVLLGEEIDGALREATVHHSSRGLFAIRQGRWKLIEGRGAASVALEVVDEIFVGAFIGDQIMRVPRPD